MQPTRRELLAGAGAAVGAGLAGCSGRLTADGATFGAASVDLPSSVQRETGYSHRRTIPEVVSREFRRFGLSRTVEVTNVVSEYDRAVELGVIGNRVQAAVFAVLSTPRIEVLGRSFNPVAEMSAADVAALLQQRYGALQDVREDGTFRASLAGEPATVTRFSAAAQLAQVGVGVDVYLYVSEAMEIGDDFVVGLAVHPQAVGARRDTVETLLAGVRHG